MTFCKIAGELQINTAWKSLPENRLGEFEWYPNYRNISIKDQHRMKIAWTNFMRDFFHPTWKSLERIWVVSHLPKVSITDQPRMNIAWANFMRDFFRTTWKTLERIWVVSHVPKHFNYRTTRLKITWANSIREFFSRRLKIAWKNLSGIPLARDFNCQSTLTNPNWKLLDRIWVVSHLPKHFNYRSTPHENRLSEFHAGFFSNNLKNAWANLSGIPFTKRFQLQMNPAWKSLERISCGIFFAPPENRLNEFKWYPTCERFQL